MKDEALTYCKDLVKEQPWLHTCTYQCKPTKIIIPRIDDSIIYATVELKQQRNKDTCVVIWFATAILYQTVKLL